MADSEKRWFQVTASIEIALKVLAQDKNDAETLFWERDEDIDMVLLFPELSLQVRSVVECDPDDEGEQVAG
jgi:hypothetical protein